MNATIRDLRFYSKELLDTVSRGEEVVITYRGKPCARLVPMSTTVQRAGKKALFGIWKDNDEIRNVDGFVRSLRKERF